MARPVLFPFRSVDTATVRYTTAPHHRRRITIDHRPLAGVTPAMLLDWFTHLDGTIEYGGAVINRYLAWHPIDHILWQLTRPAPTGGAGEGALFHIGEQFGGNPDYKIDITDQVEKLDETGLRLVQRVAGIPVFQLEHTWSACSVGAHYVSVMDIGPRAAVLSAINRYAKRRFPEPMVRAWVRHNVEEVGQLEHLLPQLADKR
jgi:hypothetical protein